MRLGRGGHRLGQALTALNAADATNGTNGTNVRNVEAGLWTAATVLAVQDRRQGSSGQRPSGPGCHGVSSDTALSRDGSLPPDRSAAVSGA